MVKNQQKIEVGNQHSPLMQQYFTIKEEYPDTLLFFQVGDFYELFFEDAQVAASFLGIALTARGKNKGEPIPLCGVPVHALDHYLFKLVKGGYKVAICDQLEQARPGSIVKRGVKQVLTPGTLTDTKLLDARSASYLFSFYPAGDSWALLFGELLTAQLFITTVPACAEKLLESELTRFFPDEILIPNRADAKEFQMYFKKLGYVVTVVHDSSDTPEQFSQWLESSFNKTITEQIEQTESMRLALHYFYAYMSKNQRASLSQFTTISFYRPDDFLILDSATQKNLELIRNTHDGSNKNTLFEIMDCAKTSMGSRMIKKWIQRPLVQKEAITQRQDIIELLIADISLINSFEQLLKQTGDVERIIGRIALDRATISDYLALMRVLSLLPEYKILLKNKITTTLGRTIGNNLGEFGGLCDFLKNALYSGSDQDWLIKQGFDEQLDEMRSLVIAGNKTIVDLEQREQQKTGISSLKIRYNTIQGYYIEVTNTHKDSVPTTYHRLQTLVGRERFMTSELQELQSSIERARKNIALYEQELFDKVKKNVFSYCAVLRKTAHALAHLDALLSLALLSYNNSYCKPIFNDTRDIIIKNGRHPVVEQALSSAFIPNTILLNDEQSLWIITGPNMGGKSTYLRQVALICVMAHIGSYVSAESANLAILDRIFTRLGAADNVTQGKSTFLVEMEETATICSQETKNSLVILDEVGRGTSTFDGLAIAQAVVEYIFLVIGARCLFATHYHELTYLHNQYPAIVSYYAVSKKNSSGIIFLYKIVSGTADGSFGIEVARLADLPHGIIERAELLVHSFTDNSIRVLPSIRADDNYLKNENYALKEENNRLSKSLQEESALRNRLSKIDFDLLSPKNAFDLLWELKDV